MALKKIWRRDCALILLIVVAGCAPTVEYVPTNAPPRTLVRRAPGSVVVFSTTQPPQPYTEVGLVEVQQRSSMTGAQDLLALMREKAAEVGCDGLIILGSNDKVWSTSYGGGTLKGYRASCFVYNAQSAVK